MKVTACFIGEPLITGPITCDAETGEWPIACEGSSYFVVIMLYHISPYKPLMLNSRLLLYLPGVPCNYIPEIEHGSILCPSGISNGQVRTFVHPILPLASNVQCVRPIKQRIIPQQSWVLLFEHRIFDEAKREGVGFWQFSIVMWCVMLVFNISSRTISLAAMMENGMTTSNLVTVRGWILGEYLKLFTSHLTYLGRCIEPPAEFNCDLTRIHDADACRAPECVGGWIAFTPPPS